MTKIFVIQSQPVKYRNILKEYLLHNFTKYFSGAQVNPIVK